MCLCGEEQGTRGRQLIRGGGEKARTVAPPFYGEGGGLVDAAQALEFLLE